MQAIRSISGSEASSDLLDDNVDLVSVLHVKVLGGLVLVEAFPVEEKADVVGLELGEDRGTDCLWQ